MKLFFDIFTKPRHLAMPDKAAETGDASISVNLFIALNLLLFCAVLPLFFEFPASIIGFVCILFAIHLASQRFAQIRFPKLLLVLLAIAGIALVLSQFHTIFGYQAGIALFALMLGLKLLEARSERDFYISAIFGLILLTSQFLLNQSMYLAIYALAIVTGLIALLVSKNMPFPGRSWGHSIRLAGLLVLQAAPLVLVIFLLFPRLSTPLWNIDLGSRTGVTGLSNTMSPGSISKLIVSDEAAFRVEFFGPRPTAENLYWRGPVLWRTSGKRWFPRKHAISAGNIGIVNRDGPEVDYRLILEPHGKNWVLPLDLPASAPTGTHLNTDFELLTQDPVNRKKHFFLTSSLASNIGAITQAERQLGLQLPLDVSDRMRQLVDQWRREAKSARELIERALRYFNRQAFVYTLSPPALYNNITDRFLFETRAGFCEHYASAFVILMRLAGLPSRVVTGYLGGEYNDVGDFVLVRQSDAHAWSEVWLEGGGWVRVDPTAAIAPERVERQISFADDNSGAPVSFRLSDEGISATIARRLLLTLDALNTRWHIWVLGYDAKKQQNFLQQMGLDFLSAYQVSMAMVAISALILLLIVLTMLKDFRKKSTDEAVTIYQRYCRKLARIGFTKQPQEGALAFSDRVTQRRPDLKQSVKAITKAFMDIHYAGKRNGSSIKRLRSLVEKFKPKGKEA